ncbi:MAG: hypothetical protein ACKN9W_09570 [Methylococcus sp.]
MNISEKITSSATVCVLAIVTSTALAGGNLISGNGLPLGEVNNKVASTAMVVKVLPSTGAPYGQTNAQWAADATKLMYSIPYDRNPFFADIEQCTVPQSGKVWLVGTASTRASCAIPYSRAMLLNFGGYSDTYPCPDSNFKPAIDQVLEDFLKRDAKTVTDSLVTSGLIPHGLKINGTQIISYDEVLKNRRFSTSLFHLKGDSSLMSSVDACVTGSSQEAVVDGFFAILNNIPVGHHTLEFTDSKGITTSALQVTVYNDRTTSPSQLIIGCSTDICGGFPQNVATINFRSASVSVSQTGLVKLNIVGLTDKITGQPIANHPFYLNFGIFQHLNAKSQFLGNFQSDANGDYKGTVKMETGDAFKFPAGTYSGFFIINDWSPQFSQFITVTNMSFAVP